MHAAPRRIALAIKGKTQTTELRVQSRWRIAGTGGAHVGSVQPNLAISRLMQDDK